VLARFLKSSAEPNAPSTASSRQPYATAGM
jgi:hypothetical protein